MLSKQELKQDHTFLYLSVFLFSLALSVWVNIKEWTINPDAICYLQSAKTISTAGLNEAMQICGQARWPLYSLLIFCLAKITHLSFATSAYLLNSFFTAASAFMFVFITQQMGANKRMLYLAAFVFLCFHTLNSVRGNIIRDHGYWFFYLTSIWILFEFFKSKNGLMAIAFNASLFLATLFRIEGAFFLIGVPFITWFIPQTSWKEKIKNFFLLISPVILILSAGILFSLSSHHDLGRFQEILLQFKNGYEMITNHYQSTKLALIQHVLNNDSARDADMILIVTFTMCYFIYLISNLTLIYSFLLGYGWTTKAFQFSLKTSLIIFAYLLINILITFIFYTQHLFLAKRYLIALSLTLMLFVPFALDKIYLTWVQNKHYLLPVAISAAFLISFAGNLINFGHSKSYIYQAGNWLAQNVPQNAKLYGNDYQLLYYSQHFDNEIFHDLTNEKNISQDKWKNFDYLALRINKHDERNVALIEQSIRYSPIKIFKNKNGDRVDIFKVEKAL